MQGDTTAEAARPKANHHPFLMHGDTTPLNRLGKLAQGFDQFNLAQHRAPSSHAKLLHSGP